MHDFSFTRLATAIGGKGASGNSAFISFHRNSGRADHPQRAVAAKQMSGGGTLVAFEVAGGKAAAFAVADALSIIGISNNLGDAKSLVTHPETTTHQRLKPEQRAALGIGPGLLRLSVGLEDVDDLIEDLDQALSAAPTRRAAE